MTLPEIPKAVRDAQIRAADPETSVFVSANAGSGKTHVLTQRVINLLLQGVDPSKILCITYTKAAAANMANRVFERLAEWIALDDAAFDRRLNESTGKPVTAAQRVLARRLFATALETPGGLKVQTIHAFCTSLLHQFPFEADVAARFEVLDDNATSDLLDRLTLDVMQEAANDPDGPLGLALTTAITAAADTTFMDLIAETIRKRDIIIGWANRAGSVPKAIDELTRAFGLTPGDSIEAIEDECLSDTLIPKADWPALLAVLSASPNKTDRDLVATFEAIRGMRGTDAVNEYLSIFCTDKLERRARVITDKLGKTQPQWAERLRAEQDRVCSLVEKRKAVIARDRSAALLTISSAVIGRYAVEKDRRGQLDYDDLIDKTLALFAQTSAAWVLYKLDLGVDHVLVDEAQDTSPKQWQIIKTIVTEFVPGGARENVRRTMFAVGDEKQSIFSFQGAAPRSFAQMRSYFGDLFTGAGVEFRNEKLPYSFRSSPIVLESVDGVFSREQAYRGLTDDQVKTLHQAVYADAPGEVEIWDMIVPDPKDDNKQGWDAPFDTTKESSPAIKLAGKIGRTVKRWCAAGTRPRDVLILVRQRGPAFEAVIRALKREGIAVAGADRLVLTEHIAVMDLLALGDALLLSGDDLALATVLKSPLFGLDEDQLFTLAYQREGSLRSSLRAKAADDPMFGMANLALDQLARAARDMTPFAFYAHVLGPLKGRQRILARLGAEANDPLDEFLNLALDYERWETPSLQGFLHWIRVAQSEVKRDMEMERDEVRVMTVHGAKGLEAENVILIDSTTVRPEGAYPPRLLTTPLGPDGATVLIWGSRQALDVGPMQAARQMTLDAARDEYRRLLYVGMTRAAERLVICATRGEKKAPDECWYNLVCEALKPLAEETADADGDKAWRLRKGETSAQTDDKAPTVAPADAPDWLRQPAAPSSPPSRILTPSGSGDDEPARFAGRGDRDKALRRGTLFHRLMQSLPDIAPDRRADAARVFLARDDDLSEAEHAEMTAQAFAILNDTRFAPLFAPGSRAEVSVAGLVGDVQVPGQIDRLVVTDTEVLIADYKTNRPAPKRIDVPPVYVRQLALYRALLQKIYPQKPVRAALLWTETPELMELSATALDTALAQVTSA
ncbi:MAG TPA: double-strand break repair helicase AddA [Pseudolabrys sp.]|nr:double-strand break repair helicase AddA [Pseudolabrys sp.]